MSGEGRKWINNMSSDKTKSQQRRKVDSLAVVKQLTICKYHNASVTIPLGRLRKSHALNCGRSHCKLCSNPRRTWGRLTLPEIKANEAFRYALIQS